MRSVGCPRDVNTARSATPRTLPIASLIFSAVSVNTTTSLPISFTEFSPLTPDTASSTLSWMYCEKLKLTPRKLRLQSCVDLLDELVLGHAFAPLLGWLQRGKELGIEEARRIGAVVGPSLLGHDRFDFGKALDRQTHAVDEVIALFE